MIIEWRPLIISILFTLAIYVVSIVSSVSALAFLGLLLGGAVVGAMIGGEIKDGLIHGLILGVITSVIILVVTLIEILSSSFGATLISLYYTQLLLILAIEIILGLVGGVLGILMRSEALTETQS